jgi:hypothetical protein
VIVRNFDVERVTVLPRKTDTVLTIDSNAMLTFSIAAQRLEAKSRVSEIAKRTRAVQNRKSFARGFFDGLKARDRISAKELTRILVGKAPDQVHSP